MVARRIRLADRPALDAARRDLAASHYRLAWHIARRFAKDRPGLDVDAFVSSAMLGLVTAAQDYPHRPGGTFARYAACRIKGEIRHDLRSARPKGYRKPGPGPSFSGLTDRSEDHGRVVNRAAVESPGSGLESAESFQALRRRLPARHARVVGYLYRDGLTARAAGRRMRCPASSVCRLHRQALEILREDPACRP